MLTQAFWLPGVRATETEPWTDGPSSPAPDLLVPRLTGDLIVRQAEALLAAREQGLAGRPIEEIVAAIDLVARRFLDDGDELRRTALELLPPLTGLSPEMAATVLTRMAEDWRRDRLLQLLVAEFGDPEVLDRFIDHPYRSGRLFAVGPALVFHVFSGNVPGVAVTSLVRALLVKSASLGKTASGEPVLPVLFARGLAEADDRLGACLAVAYWPGGNEELEAAAMARADAIVAYGAAESIASLRLRAPAGRPFLEYGNRLSLALVAREALTAEGAGDLARDAALAMATFDQQGCVSPHLVYVEGGGEVSAREWARLVAREAETIEGRLPRGSVTREAASAIQQLRGWAEMGGHAGEGAEVHASSEGTQWTIVFDPSPAFEASCLNRTLRVKPVDSIAEVPVLVAAAGPVLQTVGVAGPEHRLAPVVRQLAELGATRFTSLASMPWPKPWWHHDGRPPLGDLVRWCDWD